MNMSRSAHSSDASPAQEGQLTEWLLRGIAVAVLLWIVVQWGRVWWTDTSRWSVLVLLLCEVYTLLLVVCARRASRRDISWPALLATIYATGLMVWLQPQGTVRLAPEWVGVVLQAFSIAWHLTAKIYLGRSFGLLPAQRGLVVAGPYQFVRHPIYLGYLVGHVGFLLVNFSIYNALVIGLLYVAQVVRIQREEAVLAHGHGKAADEYRQYRTRVRWRLLPFVY
jgi:protein-S-isoprenylcysteine O-methyltransferase Ste14